MLLGGTSSLVRFRESGAERKDMKDHAKVRPIEREEFVHQDSEGSVGGEWERPGIPPDEFKPEHRKKGEKGESYDLWADLSSLKAYITVNC